MKTPIKIIHWLPRILCILAILFISMFAADAFESNLSFGQQLADFFMHLIPSYILITLLVVAWKWEFIGGIIFILLGLATAPFIFMHNYNINHFPIGNCIGIIAAINLPFIIVGLLFMRSYSMNKRLQLK